jgi:hypothetical protein
MSVNLIQPSFAAGEVSPSLFARVDLAKFKVGAATMRNFFVDFRGGAATRPGTRYVATSATPGTGLPPHLVPFQFSTLQSYVLEFGLGYIAFYKNGAPVLYLSTAYTIASPYALGDLPLLKFTQSADVLTVVHASYVPAALDRFSDTNWTLTGISFAAVQQPPTAGIATPNHGSEPAGTGDATTTTYYYAVTALSASGEESIASGLFGNPANSRIMSEDGNAFMTLTWTAPAGTAPVLYNVYRMEEVPNSGPPGDSLLGLIGSATALSYVDRAGAPDFATAPPTHQNPFAYGNNPSVTTYYGQRQWFAATALAPETFYATKTGAFTNMDTSNPSQATDAITDTLASTQVNAIKSLTPMPSGLIAFASSGAWLISGGGVNQGGIPTAISPSTIVAQPQAFNGANDLPPIVANYDLLFVTPWGTVRDFSYNFYVNIYTGTDMTVLSNHLFSGRTIRDWAYAEEPYKMVWCIRDDGVALGLTYLKEQDVYGWSRHDTNGLFQSVCVVKETVPTTSGGVVSVAVVYATYFVVKRLLGGVWVYTIERKADRFLLEANPPLGVPANIENAWCVDCGLSLPQPQPAANLIPGAGVPGTVWPVVVAGGAQAVGASVVFYADAPVFSAANVGAVIRAFAGKAVITGLIDTQRVVATIAVAFPTMPDDPYQTPLPAANGAWTMTQPVSVVGGLGYLNGMWVSILGDGNVMAPQLVAGGQVTLQAPCSSVIVGLGYTCQLQTLYLDAGDGPQGTIQGKRKKVGAVTVRVRDTRGLQAGRTAATVVAVKEWNSTINLGGPLPLVTGDQRVVLDPVYDTGGQFWMVVTDPVPCTVLGVVPEISVGDS